MQLFTVLACLFAAWSWTQYGHRFENRNEEAQFDADTFMAFYKGKNEYRSFGPPEISGSTAEPISRHDWLMLTGYTVTEAKAWKLPDLGYTQTRISSPSEVTEEEEAATVAEERE